MVTHSKFDCVMSSRYPAPQRFRTFNSKAQYQLVLQTAQRLKQSGFYWASIGGKEAGTLLASQPSGSFLIRDSADCQHFFTLSVKTSSGTKNVRVQCDSHTFFLQTEPGGERSAPHFDCVLKLVSHYMNSVKEPMTNSNPRNAYYIYSGGEKIPLELRNPLYSTTASLQHLCRKTVNSCLTPSSNKDNLPQPLKDFLHEYDAPI